MKSLTMLTINIPETTMSHIDLSTTPSKHVMKECTCGTPYHYAPHIDEGPCRFCWGYNAYTVNKNNESIEINEKK